MDNVVHIDKIALVTAQETVVTKLIFDVTQPLVNRMRIARGTMQQAFRITAFNKLNAVIINVDYFAAVSQMINFIETSSLSLQNHCTTSKIELQYIVALCIPLF